MAIRYVVRRGDPIAGGGIVLGGIGLHIYNLDGHDPTAEGLTGRCGVCGEIGRIVCTAPRPSHAPDDICGYKLALTGDILICKCPVQPKLVHTSTLHAIIIDDHSDTNTGGMPAPSSAFSSTTVPFDEQVQLISPDGQVLTGFSYKLVLETGDVIEGSTNQDGCTERICTKQATNISALEIYID